MIDLGTGIAIAGVSISGGAVAITAIKVRYSQPNLRIAYQFTPKKNRKN